MKRKTEPAGWEYRCTHPMLPSNATSPIMGGRQMEDWLNDMDAAGWEFVGYGQKLWVNGITQDWWIFRRAAKRDARRVKR